MAEKKPIDQGLIGRITGRIRATADVWFGPMTPPEPITTEAQKPSVEGRQFDYPVGFNTNSQPRSTDAVSFGQLRGLADACDIVRIIIEARKDQMSKLNWVVKPIDDSKEQDSRCVEIQDFFKAPDKEHDWDTWLRMLLEDLFVLDAPSIYVRRTVSGKPYAFEPVDGATIKRVLTAQGRTPMPPDPAYQQIFKGMAAVNYTTDELIYRPRNPRTSKVYGYSPVEQIIMTVNIALRRAVHKLQFYTEGNVPEAIVGTPETWNLDQIKLFQQHWDALNEGNTAERRHMKFVPGKLDMQMTKEAVMKDAFDEWLARIVCFAFSVEPTPFVQQVNRATADSAREAALSQGQAPIQQWVVNVMNHIIQNIWGYKDLQFDWSDEEVQAPLERAKVNEIYLKYDVVTPDEVRLDLGLDILSEQQKAEMAAAKTAKAAKAPMLPTEGEDPPPDIEEELNKIRKAASAKKAVPGHIDYDRATIVAFRAKLANYFTKFFASQVDKIADSAGLVKKEKGDLDWSGVVPDVAVILGAVVKDGAQEGLKSIASAKQPGDGVVTKWAMDRAAEMVGKKWVGGQLVDNPNATWVITDTTREMIRLMVAEAVDQGKTTKELAKTLRESFAFSRARAEMIARTEVALADQAGQMLGYEESGLVKGTEWTTAEDDKVSSDCNLNADAGMVPLGTPYPSGALAPPAHPNCRCAIVAVLKTDEELAAEEAVEEAAKVMTHEAADKVYKAAIKIAYEALMETGVVLAFKEAKAAAMAIWSENTTGIPSVAKKQSIFKADKKLAANALAGMDQDTALAQWKLDTNAEKIAANIAAKPPASTAPAAGAQDYVPVAVQTVSGAFRQIGLEDFTSGEFVKQMATLHKVMDDSSLGIDANKAAVENLLRKELASKAIYQSVYAEHAQSSTYGLERTLVSRWASTSGDSDYLAVAMQMAVRDAFGMQAEDVTNAGMKLMNHASEAEVYKFAAAGLGVDVSTSAKLSMFQSALKEFAVAQYNVTQNWFAKQGITEVYLVRGMRDVGSKSPTAVATELKLQPASSFSTSTDIAAAFAGRGGNVYVVRVPVSQVIGSFLTGYGCTKESEVVVLAHSGLKAIQMTVNDRVGFTPELVQALAAETLKE